METNIKLKRINKNPFRQLLQFLFKRYRVEIVETRAGIKVIQKRFKNKTVIEIL